MRRSGDDYAEALGALLPTGVAWPRDPDAALAQLVSGLAQVWASPDGRAADLLELETDPRRTFEMPADWERAFGLPEGVTTFAPRRTFTPFSFGPSSFGGSRGRIKPPIVDLTWIVTGYLDPEARSVPERQSALVEKLTRGGGQSRPFFVGLAASLGYPIEIREFGPFQFGLSSFGGRRGQIYPPSARFFWTVIVHGQRTTRFQFGASSFGRSSILALRRADDLESLFRRLKPAHTEIIFQYDGDPVPDVIRFQHGQSSFGNDPILKLAA